MKRGDLIVAAMRGDFSGKPRPYLIVQADRTIALATAITACPITSEVTGIGRIRIAIAADPATGLQHPSEVEVDRILTLRRDRIREVIGTASASVMRQVDRSLMDWLDL